MEPKNENNRIRSMCRTLREVFWEFSWLHGMSRRLQRSSPRAARALVVAVTAALVLVVLFMALLVQDVAGSGGIFKGVTVAGLPVGGLSKTEAEKLVKEKVSAPMKEPVVIRYDDERFTLEPGEIGLHIDTDRMIDEAYWAGRGRFVLERMFRRLTGKPLRVNIPVLIRYDEKKLEGFVSEIADRVDAAPRNAYIDVSEGFPTVVLGKYGVTVDQGATLKEIREALPTRVRDIDLVTRSIRPDITSEDIGYIVVIRLKEHTLYLYKKSDLVSSYRIAVGMPEYPTPTGKFHITHKEENPTWLPTSEWAKDKRGIPQPPGPDNPLGKYWMDLGGGIGIHATPYEGSLGEDASHGCIRMATWAAEELFNRVKVGTPVFILP